MAQLKPEKRGYSLLEVLIAMLLFSTIVVFMATIWANHAKMIGKSRSRMTAAFIAEQITEEYIAKGYLAAKTEAAQSHQPINVTTVMRGHEIITPYEYSVSVEDPPANAEKPLVGVLRVVVKFPDEQANSAFKEITYETYLSKPTD